MMAAYSFVDIHIAGLYVNILKLIELSLIYSGALYTTFNVYYGSFDKNVILW